MEKRYVGTQFIPTTLKVCGTCGGRKIILSESDVKQEKKKRNKKD